MALQSVRGLRRPRNLENVKIPVDVFASCYPRPLEVASGKASLTTQNPR
jgi:hypothetical protein